MSALLEHDGELYLIEPYEWALSNGFLCDAHEQGLAKVIQELAYGFLNEPPKDIAKPVRLPTRYQRREYLLDWIAAGAGKEPIVSDRLRRFIEPRVPGLIYIPALVGLNSNYDDHLAMDIGEWVEGYWWLYCPHRITVFDDQESEFVIPVAPNAAYEARNPPHKRSSWVRAVPVKPQPAAPGVFKIANNRANATYISTDLHQALIQEEFQIYFAGRPLVRATQSRGLLKRLNPRGTRREPQISLSMTSPDQVY